MARLFVFGLGYTAQRLAARVEARGWTVIGTSRDGHDGTVRFDAETNVVSELGRATHILASVPPADDGDPVLARYGDTIAVAPARWIGYLSSTGVYGDCGGAWVDEAAPVRGRRMARNRADAAWQALRGDVRAFRLPGIYGPGRSALDRVASGRAHRVDLPDQVFSRAHVDDITSAIIASFETDACGPFNIADDAPCSQNLVIEAAADLLGQPWPVLIAPEDPSLGPMSRAFYAENRRVANGRAKRLLGWAPRYPDFRSGLAACLNIDPSLRAKRSNPE